MERCTMTARDWGYAAGKIAVQTQSPRDIARQYNACAHGFSVEVLGFDPEYVRGMLQAFRDAENTA